MKKITYAVLAAAIIAADRMSKNYLLTIKKVDLTSWLTLDLSFNRGISWGLFHSSDFYSFFILSFLIGLFILALSHYTYQRAQQGFNIVGETLVLAGACSNFLDRIFYHGVIDFIVFSYKGFYWPSFNIADAAIVVGAFIMIINNLKEGYAPSH